MNSNSLLLIVGASLAATLGAGRPARSAGMRDSDACWFQGNASEIAQRRSPHDSASIALDGGTVKVCYGRPHQNGREIMGKLVPYGEPWRMGADEATVIHVPFAATIAGVSVAPGWYSLYAVPSETQWTIVVNSVAQRWGIPIDAQVRAKDVGTGTVAAEHLAAPAEELTIALTKSSPSAATMDVAWGSSHVRVPIRKR